MVTANQIAKQKPIIAAPQKTRKKKVIEHIITESHQITKEERSREKENKGITKQPENN